VTIYAGPAGSRSKKQRQNQTHSLIKITLPLEFLTLKKTKTLINRGENEEYNNTKKR